MIIDAEFNEIEETGGELDLSEDDGLPWLEPDEEDERAGGIDTAQLIGFVAVLLAVLLGVVGLVYFLSNSNKGGDFVADGSTIEAPEGPYKTRPEDAGGKEFAGTGDVAPSVGQGEAPEARLADGAGAGDGDLNIAMPPIEGGETLQGSSQTSRQSEQSGSSESETPATAPTAAPGSVGVQLAAYSSRARAEKGWTDLKRKSRVLGDYEHRVVVGKTGIGTVYRLQALASDRAKANALCKTLKSEGLDCQVKR